MKVYRNTALALVLGTAVFALTGCAKEKAASAKSEAASQPASTLSNYVSKDGILLAYFSRRGQNHTDQGIQTLEVGNTERVALKISDRLKQPAYQIQTVKPYTDDFKEMLEVAKKEQAENARPALKEPLPDMKPVKTLVLGYPIWHGTMPMAVFSFLEKVGCDNITIVPFNTHGSSGVARSVDDLRKVCPKATVMEGTSIKGTLAAGADKEATEIAQKARP